MPWRFLRMEEHFELVKANFIRCEECNENFFFDFLRHPRYFVAHFKSCHLKNLLYRFNGHSEEENSRVRFGPRRKKDANSWFGQLKSTEKRMISMQDNKWSEISEKECWSCRLCNDGKTDLTQVFDLSELGRGQAFLHLRQVHERAYEEFLRKLPDVQNAALLQARAGELLPLGHHQSPHARSRVSTHSSSGAVVSGALSLNPDANARRAHYGPGSEANVGGGFGGSSGRSGVNALDSSPHRTVLQQRMAEAERSRLRRMNATPEDRQMEALRSKKRRENLTPVQRQADYDRRKRKKKRQEESERSRKRREQASEEMRQKEVLRSRERRRNATEDQRKREAMRSKRRRENASEEQKLKERERCRKRYEMKKTQKGSGSNHSSSNSSGNASDGSQSSTSASEYHHRRRHHQHHLEREREYEHHQHHFDARRQQEQTTRPPSHTSSLTIVPILHPSGGNAQVPPIDTIRVPTQHTDETIRASFSELAGFRLFSPSPSAAASFGSISGGGRTGHTFPTAGLSMYPHHHHLSATQLLRGSAVGGSSSSNATAAGGGGSIGGTGHGYASTPAASTTTTLPSPFAIPQLPPSLQALSQSLHPLPSAISSASMPLPSSSPSSSATNAAMASIERTSSPLSSSQSGRAVALDMIGSHLQHHHKHPPSERPSTASSGSSNLAFV